MTIDDLNRVYVQPDPRLDESTQREFRRGAEAMRAAIISALRSHMLELPDCDEVTLVSSPLLWPS